MAREQTAQQNQLVDGLRERIRRNGPISFCEWMQTALYDRSAGYYCRYRFDPAGTVRGLPHRAGNQSAVCRLRAEFSDICQTSAPEVFAATGYLIDEVSPGARQTARTNLAQFSEQVEFVRLNEIAAPFEFAIVF